jgi:hypothetical protein
MGGRRGAERGLAGRGSRPVAPPELTSEDFRMLDAVAPLLQLPAVRSALEETAILDAMVAAAAQLIANQAARVHARRAPTADLLSDPERWGSGPAPDWFVALVGRLKQDLLARQGELVGQIVDSIWRHLLAWALKEAGLQPAAVRALTEADALALLQGVMATQAGFAQVREVLIKFNVPKLAEPYFEALRLEERPVAEVRQFLQGDLELTPAWPAALPVLWEGHLPVLNALPYEVLREALFKRLFTHTDGTPWPTAALDRGGTRGRAQMRPVAIDERDSISPEETAVLAQRMWDYCNELSDLDADALDALSSIWLAQARSPNDDAVADVDDLLAMRGLRTKRGGQGRRGGYAPKQRQAMLRAISHLQSLWLDMAEVEVIEADGGAGRRGQRPTKRSIQSRPFVITDRVGQVQLDGGMTVEKFIFRPGKLFGLFLMGPGRQTALLSARALQYDPYRETWEKRLTRYLSYQWRVRASGGNYLQPFRVSTLLEAVGERIDARHPNRTKERLEEALNTLANDGVFARWQYDRWDESRVERRGWLADWCQALVLVEPPAVVVEAYRSIERHEATAPRRLPAPTGALGDQLKAHRQRRGLSQRAAARELAIAQSYFGMLERNEVTPSTEVQARLRTWLDDQPRPE